MNRSWSTKSLKSSACLLALSGNGHGRELETDIYNGQRGKSFDQEWRFNLGDSATATGLTAGTATVNDPAGIHPRVGGNADPAAALAVAMENPYRPGGMVHLAGSEDARMVAQIFNVTGKPIARIDLRGARRFQWNGRDLQGQAVPKGVYVLTLKSGKSAFRRLFLLN